MAVRYQVIAICKDTGFNIGVEVDGFDYPSDAQEVSKEYKELFTENNCEYVVQEYNIYEI